MYKTKSLPIAEMFACLGAACVLVTPVLGFIPILTLCASMFAASAGVSFIKKYIVKERK